MSGTTLDLATYLEMVDDALAHFTDLRLVVDRFVVGPERLGMAFRETARSARHGRTATWHGVALYEFSEDGRLASCSVEQDFWGRRRQFTGEAATQTAGETARAVWDTPIGDDTPGIRGAVAAGVAGLEHAAVDFDDGSLLLVRPDGIRIDDMVVGGRDFAVALTITGAYVPESTGPNLALRSGDRLELPATGTGTVREDGTISGRFVTDRYGVWLRHRQVS